MTGAVASGAIDSKRAGHDNGGEMGDEDLPRPRGDVASKLAAEDLGPYSQDELGERIGLLEAEIARIRSHRSAVAAHRNAADALFGRKE